MTFLGALATIVGIFLGLANLPQALKIFKTKSAKDISLTTYIIITGGSIIWILYGIEIKSIPVVLPNILGFFLAIVVMVGYVLYGKTTKK